MRIFFMTAFWALTTLLWAQNTIGTTDYSPDLAAEGYTLLYPHNQPHVYLVKSCIRGPTRTHFGQETWLTCKTTETL